MTLLTNDLRGLFETLKIFYPPKGVCFSDPKWVRLFFVLAKILANPKVREKISTKVVFFRVKKVKKANLTENPKT